MGEWVGLNNIYALTNRPGIEMQLRISMEKFTTAGEHTATAYYDTFSLEDRILYRLNVSQYHGTSGDKLSYANGAAFSTIDNDNDVWTNNCATQYKGAWWYTACHGSNLNGYNYGSIDTTPYATGIVWHSVT